MEFSFVIYSSFVGLKMNLRLLALHCSRGAEELFPGQPRVPEGEYGILQRSPGKSKLAYGLGVVVMLTFAHYPYIGPGNHGAYAQFSKQIADGSYKGA